MESVSDGGRGGGSSSTSSSGAGGDDVAGFVTSSSSYLQERALPPTYHSVNLQGGWSNVERGGSLDGSVAGGVPREDLGPCLVVGKQSQARRRLLRSPPPPPPPHPGASSPRPIASHGTGFKRCRNADTVFLSSPYLSSSSATGRSLAQTSLLLAAAKTASQTKLDPPPSSVVTTRSALLRGSHTRCGCCAPSSSSFSSTTCGCRSVGAAGSSTPPGVATSSITDAAAQIAFLMSKRLCLTPPVYSRHYHPSATGSNPAGAGCCGSPSGRVEQQKTGATEDTQVLLHSSSTCVVPEGTRRGRKRKRGASRLDTRQVLCCLICGCVEIGGYKFGDYVQCSSCGNNEFRVLGDWSRDAATKAGGGGGGAGVLFGAPPPTGPRPGGQGGSTTTSSEED